MPKSCERKKKFGLKTPRRAPPLGGVGGFVFRRVDNFALELHGFDSLVMLGISCFC